jgi:N-acyl-D-amino-acid deacylase
MISAHPRAYGSFPRLISYYVRDLGAISLERAVAQSSATAANDVKLYDRGRIAVGLAADLIAFDYEHLADNADFGNPRALSTGMRYVIVNGQLVLAAGEPTKARPGRVLRGPGWKRDTAAANISIGVEEYSEPEVNTMLASFIEEHAVPGMSVAIADRGQLVYSRGFGYADIAKRDPVTPHSLFRIASVSKPITGVAIMQLVEQGKLDLDAKVTEILDLSQGIRQAGEQFDPRWHQITVRHLLQHRGGWDRDVSFDAMFRSVSFAEQEGVRPPASPSTVIQAMLKVKLDFDPGQRYAYSNFGYCLLGRIIEKISQQEYETYVREHVLAKVGVAKMRIGASRLNGREENEVRYYQPGTGTSVFASDLGTEVPWPYGGWYLEAMDAHGGWIASAEDLIRFATALDNAQSSPLLNETSIKQLFERPVGAAGYEADGKEKEVYYSLGWSNRVVGPGAVSNWHTGSLNGTATVLIRRHDGMTMVALMNSRVSPKTEHLGRESEAVLHRAASYLRSKRNDETQR